MAGMPPRTRGAASDSDSPISAAGAIYWARPKIFLALASSLSAKEMPVGVIKCPLVPMATEKTTWMIKICSTVQRDPISTRSITSQISFRAIYLARKRARAGWRTIRVRRVSLLRLSKTWRKCTIEISILLKWLFKLIFLTNSFLSFRKMGSSSRMGISHKSKPSQQMNSSANLGNLGVAATPTNDP